MVLSIFVMSSAINFLDRQSLASLAPLVRDEFHLTNTDLGWLVTAFSVTYAVGAPFSGMLLDRIGLTAGITLAVALWSMASMACGLTQGLGSLFAARAVLGLAESAGIPAAGKAIYQCLQPPERALGNAVNQAGVSAGMMLAPPLATWLAMQHGWRTAFLVTGALGLAWIPLWRRVAPAFPATPPVQAPWQLLREKRLWIYVVANGLSMVMYSLWANWTTLFLVDRTGLTLKQAAWYAWVPPLFLLVGGAAGGSYSMRLMRGGMEAIPARIRTCLLASVVALAAALAPHAGSAGLAVTAIGVSLFAVSAFSVNMYTLPLDTFGGARAAFGVSLLVAAYGATQAIISPAVGAMIDRYGYTPVCHLAAVTTILPNGLLRWTESAKS